MIYMFLASGFEEVEALCPLDLMRRADLEVTTVGIGSKFIRGAHNITVEADVTDKDCTIENIDMIFLPGGMPGTVNLKKSKIVRDAIVSAHDTDKYIAAICAAPSILGELGLLKSKTATCFPGFETSLTGACISDDSVVLDGKILTAKGMGVAYDMGIKIVEIFRGEEYAQELRYATMAK